MNQQVWGTGSARSSVAAVAPALGAWLNVLARLH